MEVTLLFRIALVGILVAMLNQILKQSGREEQAFFVNIAGIILVLLWVIPYVSQLFKEIQKMFAM